MITLFLMVLVTAGAVGAAVAFLLRRNRAYPPALESGPPSLLGSEPPQPVRDPTLPAYVDHEDDASMAAWNKAQEELETQW